MWIVVPDIDQDCVVTEFYCRFEEHETTGFFLVFVVWTFNVFAPEYDVEAFNHELEEELLVVDQG